jgi:TetR/AcrR family transcriptional repressor of nem operon
MSRQKEFKEETVLNKAVNLFWEKGYYDSSAQDIVDAIGLSRSSIYSTFTDKKTLFTKALQHYRKRQSQELLDYLRDNEPTKENIRKLLEDITNKSLNAKKCKGCLILNTATELGHKDPEVTEIIQENIAEVTAALEKFISKGQKQGTLSKTGKAKDLAVFLFQSIASIRVTTKVMTDKKFFKSNIDTILQVL